MIHHVVTFRWKEGVDPSHADTVAAALRRLPGLIPEIAEYACGPDLALAPTTLDFAVAWSPIANFQLDAGINIGLNAAATPYQIYMGIAQRF